MSTRDTGNPSSRGTLALACCLTVAVGASASSGGGASAARSAALRPVASHATPGVPRAVIAPVSFRNQVIPVLTKAGCNSGACHGAAAGKNGFGLTLARLRPGCRLRHDHAAGGWPPRQQDGAGQEPDPAQTDGDRAAHGRHPLQGRVARVRHHFRLDRLGLSRAARQRSPPQEPRRHAAGPDARRRRDAAVARDGAFHRWLDRRRDAVGEVRVGRRDRRPCRGRRAGEHQGLGRDGRQRELSDRCRPGARALALSGRRSPIPRSRNRQAPASSTISCWESCASCTSRLLPSAPTASSFAAPISTPRASCQRGGRSSRFSPTRRRTSGRCSSTGCSSATSS